MKRLIFAILLTMSAYTYAKPLKVYILAGQSNMQGHAHIRTFEHMAHSVDGCESIQFSFQRLYMFTLLSFA